MAKKWCACPLLGVRFLAITQPFMGANWANSVRDSGDHYLSIGGDKSELQYLFLIFDFWATFGEKWA